MQITKEIKSVSIVGTGNLGWHMAKAIHAAGLEIYQIISRSLDTATELAKIVSAVPGDSTSELDKIPDLFIICVNDEAIANVATYPCIEKTLVVHTSGSIGLDVFKKSAGKYGVFYPLQTFTKKKEMDYSGIPFLIEGVNQDVEERLVELANKISGNSYRVNSHTRKKIHLTAVFACNFSNHMAAIANLLLKEDDLDINLLLPLMEQTIAKLKSLDPLAAQTGPAVRDDQEVIARHMELLKDHSAERKIYKILTDNIISYKTKYE